MTLPNGLGVSSVMAAPAALVAFSHLRFSQIRGRQPYLHCAKKTVRHHVFRCTVCGEEFDRKTYGATLRSQDRSGGDCYGQVEIMLESNIEMLRTPLLKDLGNLLGKQHSSSC
jgi:hypothetical protein